MSRSESESEACFTLIFMSIFVSSLTSRMLQLQQLMDRESGRETACAIVIHVVHISVQHADDSRDILGRDLVAPHAGYKRLLQRYREMPETHWDPLGKVTAIRQPGWMSTEIVLGYGGTQSCTSFRTQTRNH